MKKPTLHALESATSFLRGIGRSSPRTSAHWLSRFYTRFLQLITWGRGLPRSINGEPVMYIQPEYRYLGAAYEPDVCAWLKSRIKPGQVVLDIGAQIGIYSVMFSRWVGQSGRVCAFDPSPEAIRTLRTHLDVNNCQHNTTVVACALGDKDARATLYACGSNPVNSLARPPAALIGAEEIEVKVTRLDSFCAQQSITPHVVKIDTEGWEYHILNGAGRLLENADILFVVEMHPYAWKEAGYNRQQFEEFLSSHHLRPVPLTGQRDPLGEYGDVWLDRSVC